MAKEKKLYRVFEKITTVNDWNDSEPQYRPLGYTHAVSEKQAITNVKKQLGIKRKNRYVKDFNYGSSSIIYEFVAKEDIWEE